MSDVPHNEEHSAVNQTNQQNVVTNYGHVIGRVENLSIYYSTPRAAEPDVEPISNSEIGPNPYRGLRAFREEDHAFFFGRRQQTYKLWKMLKALYEHPSVVRFLPVYGPSGSGKSSLVRAGLLPVIGQHSLSSQEHTRVAILEPRTQPLKGLALALARMATGDDSPVAKAREFYRELQQRNEREQYDGLWRIVRSLPGTELSSVIIAVDQFEEIYSQCKDKRQRLIFINNLLTAAADKSRLVIVVVTLRSDFLGETQTHPWLNRLFSKHGYLVPAMNEVELRQAIMKPAEKAGHPLDAATVTLLIQETQQREGALPLLQVALSDIWNGLRNGKEPGQTLQEIGGVGGALAKKAEAIFQALTLEQQTIARRVFLGVIQLGEGTQDTRRRAQIISLVAKQTTGVQVREVIERFAWREARLLTLAADNEGNETVEVTHEALIEHWRRLNEWVGESREDIRFQRRLQEAAQNWDKQGQAEGCLWRSPDLDILQSYYQKVDDSMTPLEIEFFKASVASVERTEQERKRLEQERQQVEQERQQADKRRREQRYSLVWMFRIAMATLLITPIGFNISARRQMQLYEQKAAGEADPVESLIYRIAAVGIGKNPFVRFPNLFQAELVPEDSLREDLQEIQSEKVIQIPTNFWKDSDSSTSIYSLAFSPDNESIIASMGFTTLVNYTDPFQFNCFHSESIPHESEKNCSSSYGLVRILDLEGNTTVERFQWNEGWRQHAQDLQISTLDENPTSTALLGHHFSFLRANYDFSENRGLVVSHDENSFSLWNLEGEELADISAPGISSMALAHDGQSLVTGNDKGSIHLWSLDDLEKGPSISKSIEAHEKSITSIAFSFDGNTIVSGSADDTLRLWNLEGEAIGRSLEGHEGNITSVAFSPDGETIASGSDDSTIRLWNVERNLSKENFHFGSIVTRLSADFNNGVHFLKYISTITNNALSPIILASSHDHFHLLTSNGDLIIKGKLSQPVQALASFEDKSVVVTVDVLGDSIKFWELKTNLDDSENDRFHLKFIDHFSLDFDPFSNEGNFTSVAVTPVSVKNNHYIVALSYSGGKVVLFDSDFFGPEWQENSLDALEKKLNDENIIQVSNRSITLLDFSPDGTTLALVTENGTVHLWDVINKKSIRAFKPHTSKVTSIVFSPVSVSTETGIDLGYVLATSGLDKKVRLWDMEGNAIDSKFKGFNNIIESLEFSPSGKFIVGVSSDRVNYRNFWDIFFRTLFARRYESKIHFWDLKGNSLGKPFSIYSDNLLTDGYGYADTRITDVTFSPDGATIAFGSENGDIRLWNQWDQNYRWKSLLEISCSRVAFPVLDSDADRDAQTACEKYADLSPGLALSIRRPLTLLWNIFLITWYLAILIRFTLFLRKILKPLWESSSSKGKQH